MKPFHWRRMLAGPQHGNLFFLPFIRVTDKSWCRGHVAHRKNSEALCMKRGSGFCWDQVAGSCLLLGHGRSKK